MCTFLSTVAAFGRIEPLGIAIQAEIRTALALPQAFPLFARFRSMLCEELVSTLLAFEEGVNARLTRLILSSISKLARL